MGDKSKIEWTDATWNPVTGCTKISAGCKNCYAERIAKRFNRSFDVTVHHDRIIQPLHWRKPRMVFVNSMSDLFHPHIPMRVILEIFGVMWATPEHTYQILTKRAHRFVDFPGHLYRADNIWCGVSVENKQYIDRIDVLRDVPTTTRFVSFEPLLESLGVVNLDGVHWVIVGGESGPGARPMKAEWAREIRDQCIEQNVPFFFKQWGGVHKKKNGRILDGITWDEMPLAPAHGA